MNIKVIVKTALAEDLGDRGDVTSQACIAVTAKSKAKVISRQDGVVAGVEYFREVFRQLDEKIQVTVIRKDGEKVSPNDEIARLAGPSRAILSGERTALNFLGHLSGVATAANKLAKLIEGTGVILLDTRKTLPGLRRAEKFAVTAGGGANHRIGLYDMVLIKENHIRAAGGITAALQKSKEYLLEKGLPLKIEIEVTNIEELKAALAQKPDRIMLDNFSLDGIKEAVTIAKGKAEIEISGGVNEKNIREYAEAGPDFISVGRITQSAAALDLSMLFEG